MLFEYTGARSYLLVVAAVTLFFAAGAPAVFAQDETPVYVAGFADGQTTCIFGENVNVRKEAKIAGDNVVDKLQAGVEVRITGSGADHSIDGVTQKWYRVQYKKDGAEKSGYVWGGFLSLAYASLKSGGRMALAGIKKYDQKEGFIGELRIVSDGKILSAAAFTLQNMDSGGDKTPYSYSVSCAATDKMGFSQFGELVSVKCSYEACGYPNGTNWFGVAPDDKVYFIAADVSISEAGVFNSDTVITFPSDKGGIKDGIIITGNSSEFDEKKNAYVLKSSNKETFEWKNGGFVKVK